MTANGKLDHSALRDAMPHPGRPLHGPLGTELERLVSQIAGQLLGLAVVGADEDLFDLGANSMAVIALTARLSERIGRSVPNHLVYSARTVRALAARIEARSSPDDSRTAQRVLARASLIRKRPSR